MTNEVQLDDDRIQFDVNYLMRKCIDIVNRTPKGKKANIVLPVAMMRASRKSMNRIRFDANDRESPLGIVVRDDAWMNTKYPKHVIARFDAVEMFRWMAVKVGMMNHQPQTEPPANG